VRRVAFRNKSRVRFDSFRVAHFSLAFPLHSRRLFLYHTVAPPDGKSGKRARRGCNPQMAPAGGKRGGLQSANEAAAAGNHILALISYLPVCGGVAFYTPVRFPCAKFVYYDSSLIHIDSFWPRASIVLTRYLHERFIKGGRYFLQYLCACCLC
jgi:hypothetical protein